MPRRTTTLGLGLLLIACGARPGLEGDPDAARDAGPDAAPTDAGMPDAAVDAALHCPLSQPNASGTVDTPAGLLNLVYARAGVLRAECGDSVRIVFNGAPVIPAWSEPQPRLELFNAPEVLGPQEIEASFLVDDNYTHTLGVLDLQVYTGDYDNPADRVIGTFDATQDGFNVHLSFEARWCDALHLFCP